MNDRRHTILREGLDLKDSSGLEIGPLCSPVVSKAESDVAYVDWASTETLVERYRDDPNVDVDRIVTVDAIWGGHALLDCLGGHEVDYVIASHVAEHVPDLISWLQEVRSVLKPGGELRLVLPDKRFSFDYSRAETDISDLLAAFAVKARRPQLREVIDFKVHVTFTADGCSVFAGTQKVSEVTPLHTLDQVMAVAQTLLDDPACYIDVHCWVFTPAVFARLMERIAGYGLLDLACSGFIDTTPENGFEFYVFLKPSDDRAEVAESWRRMADAAQDPLPGSGAAQAAADLTRQLGGAPGPHKTATASSDIQLALATAERRITELERSTSWRLTAPLRGLSRAARQIRRPDRSAP